MSIQDPFAPKPQFDPDAFMMGGGATTGNFPVIGTEYTGKLLTKKGLQRRDLKKELMFWDDGAPQMQVAFTLQCKPFGYKMDKRGVKTEFPDDDGKRTLYAHGKMREAIRDAVLKAGAEIAEIGGFLTVTYTGDGAASNPAYDPPKLYSALWVPPSQAAADAALME